MTRTQPHSLPPIEPRALPDWTRIGLSNAERQCLHFMPQILGGRVVSEAMQQRLQDLSLVSAPLSGERTITALGRLVKRGHA